MESKPTELAGSGGSGSTSGLGPEKPTHERRPQRAVHGARWYPDTPPATAEPPHCGLIGVLWLASSLGGRPCHPLARGRASWHRTAAASPSRESKHTGVGFRAAARAVRWEPAAVVTTQSGARGMWDGEPNPPNWPVLEGQAAHRAWARRIHARETAAEGRARGEVVSGHPPCHGGTAPLWPDRRPLAGLEPRRTTVSPRCTRQSILAQDSRCLAILGRVAGPDQEWQEELAATVGEATVKRVPERHRGGPRMPDQGLQVSADVTGRLRRPSVAPEPARRR